MNLSYSLLDHFESCQFRTKLFDFERVPKVEAAGDIIRSLVGEFAHEGQKAAILGEDVRTAIRRKLWRFENTVLPSPLREEWPAERFIDRACGMVARWQRSVPDFDYRDLRPAMYFEGRTRSLAPEEAIPPAVPMVDQKLWLPLVPPIGIFDALVIRPDFVGMNVQTGHTWVYDWKWVSALDEPDAIRYDLQSAMYQWGLKRLGIEVVGHAWVQGLIEEPTAFRVNKGGTVSARAVRNSWEEYVAACNRAGHEPDELMRSRCMPTFRHLVNFRSMREVDAIWQQTVVPKALAISRAAEGAGFARRWAKFICSRCPVREDCSEGQLGHHEDARFNRITLEAR